MKVTNISEGPRGLNAKGGPVLVEPKQTVDVEMADAEYQVSKATGWFEFSGKAEKEDDGLDRDELKAQAKELGIEHAGNISNVKLKELIDAKLAE